MLIPWRVTGFFHEQYVQYLDMNFWFSPFQPRTREDDLTVSVGEIVQANTALLQQLARGFPRQILEAWDTWIKKIRHSIDGKLYYVYFPYAPCMGTFI